MNLHHTRSEIRNIWLPRIAGIVAVATLAVSCSPISHQERDAKQPPARESQKQPTEDRIRQVAAKFNATVFQDTELGPKSPADRMDLFKKGYTINWQRALRPKNDRPLALNAFIEDVEETPKGAIAEFTLLDGPSIGDRMPVILRVQAGKQLLDKILAAQPSDDTMIARDLLKLIGKGGCIIIVKIDSVRKVRAFKTDDRVSKENDIVTTLKGPLASVVAEGELLEWEQGKE
jgi:hypothetical protein